MSDYSISGAREDDYATIHATHPALPGTNLLYVFADGATSRTPVILWGVMGDATPVPITLDGVWDGTKQSNVCVEFPSGVCAKFESVWESVDDAIADLRSFA